MSESNNWQDYVLTTSEDATGGNKYQVQTFTFPTDLYGSPEKYGNSWVMININVLENSKVLTGAGQPSASLVTSIEADVVEDSALSAAEKNRRRGTYFDTRTLNTTEAAAASGAAGAGVGFLAGLKSFLSSNGSVADKLSSAVAGGVQAGALAAASTALVAYAGNMGRKTKRLKNAIQLPMPNSMVIGYTANWDQDSTMLLDLLQRTGSVAIDAVKNLNMPSPTGAVADAAAAQILGAQGLVGAGGLSAQTGIAANPKKEMVFDGVDFRTFTLDYKFYPKSQYDTLLLMSIIHQLKFHMHPEYQSEGKFTFVYPSEFDITFYHKGTENPFVAKIATCVLTNMSVNYTPDGQWAGHEDGSPNAIQVSLSFKELSIQTKESIAKGF